jgi:hypothetical protein
VLYTWRSVSPRARVAFCAIAASAPAIWMLTDLLIAHDALHSLHGTAALADEQDRRRHISQVPYWTAQYFGFTLREPLVVGVPIGLVFAWLYRRRAAALPVAVAAAMTLVFAIGPLFGLPLIGRYLRTPAVLLALFYGLAVCGWTLLPEGRARRRWLAVGMFSLALSVAFVPRQVGMLEGLHTRIDREGKLYGDLRDAGHAPSVRSAYESCGFITAADHRPMPYLRYWLGGRPGSVGTVEGGPVGGPLLVPRRTYYARHFYKENFPTVKPPPGYHRVYENRTWRVFAPAACR